MWIPNNASAVYFIMLCLFIELKSYFFFCMVYSERFTDSYVLSSLKLLCFHSYGIIIFDV